MIKTFEGKTIWLTGASSGIGFEIAKKLLECRANLILSSSNVEKLKNVFNDFPQQNLFLAPFDLKSETEIDLAYKSIEEKFSYIDILINNAGVAKFQSVCETDIHMFDEMMDVNFRGAFLCTKKVLPKMLTIKNGAIVNILSVAATTTFEGSAIYSASKAAMLAFSRTLRQEVRQDGIKIIDVLPGATNTELWDEESRKTMGDKMMSSESVAQCVLETLQNSINGNLLIEEIYLRPQFGDL